MGRAALRAERQNQHQQPLHLGNIAGRQTRPDQNRKSSLGQSGYLETRTKREKRMGCLPSAPGTRSVEQHCRQLEKSLGADRSGRGPRSHRIQEKRTGETCIRSSNPHGAVNSCCREHNADGQRESPSEIRGVPRDGGGNRKGGDQLRHMVDRSCRNVRQFPARRGGRSGQRWHRRCREALTQSLGGGFSRNGFEGCTCAERPGSCRRRCGQRHPQSGGYSARFS